MPGSSSSPTAKRRVAFDSGMVIALSRKSASAFALLDELARIAFFIIPAPVLAEVLRGKPSDSAIHWVLNKYADDVVPTNGSAARAAGRALGSTKARLIVDALIGATALEHGAKVIVTGDSRDYHALFGLQLKTIEI